MGVVYRATQEMPIRRDVAVKLIRRGLESEQVLRRFDAEYQVLARMDHPGIARVLDAGGTEDGRPFFVMEMVAGEPIHRYCRRQESGLDARLGLFLQVCEAVQHAHRNGIIHRDLKPSNVLVTTRDGRAVPKVIDFGIAKALAPDPTAPQVTEMGQLMGTLEYMSPEQATYSPRSVDIRTDVYSLGALLYELLCGSPPFDPEALRAGGMDDALRRIAREEPPLPSTRAGSSSGKRGLAADLDSIVMKALEKDRDRRYESAAALADDVRRYRSNEPVEACSWTVAYRISKLFRKHRALVTAGGVALALLVAFAVTMTLQATRIAAERDRAEEVSEFLVKFYEAPVFLRNRHDRPTALDVLRISAAKVERGLPARPVLTARLTFSMGRILGDIGQLPDAERMLAAADTRFAALGDLRGSLAARHHLAMVRGELGHPDAENLMLEALDARQGTSDDFEVLWSMVEIGNHYKRSHRYEEAARHLRRASEALDRRFGREHPDALVARSLLAAAYLDQGELDDAARLIDETLPFMDESLGERCITIFNRASIQAIRGRRAEALRGLRESLDCGFRVSPRALRDWQSLLDDPEFIALTTRSELWAERGALGEQELAHRIRGEFAEAERLVRRILATPLDEAQTQRWNVSLIKALIGLRRFEEARPLVEENLRYSERVYGSSSPVILGRRRLLLDVQLGLSDVSGALATIEEQLAQLKHPRRYGWGEEYWKAARAALHEDIPLAAQHLHRAARLGMNRADWLREDRVLEEVRRAGLIDPVLEEMRRHTWIP